MSKKDLYDLVLSNMLDKTKHNVVVSKLKQGKLAIGYEKSTIEVLEPSGKRHYLVHVSDSVTLGDKGKVELHGNVRNAIAKEFVARYTYEDVLSCYDDYVRGIQAKIDKANNTKYMLEALVEDIKSISGLGIEPVILTDNIVYAYYISYKLGLCNNLELYLNGKDRFKCRYNGTWLDVGKSDLKDLIHSMVTKYNKDNAKVEEANIRRKIVINKNELIDKFVDSVWYSNKEVVVKLKSSYQCISRGRRYSVGDGKEGKYFKIPTWHSLREYVEKKGINEYYILPNSDITLTDEILKSLPYSKILQD